MDQPFISRILYRVMRVCVNPAEERCADPPGELNNYPRKGEELETLWPGHMDIREQDTDTGAGSHQYHQFGVGEKKRTTDNQGTHQGKGHMMTSDHAVVRFSTGSRQLRRSTVGRRFIPKLMR